MSKSLNGWYSPRRMRVAIDCGVSHGAAKQEFRDECDINRIMAKYGPREMLQMTGPRQAQFGDFSTVGDYQQALDMVRDAAEVFGTLPAGLRAKHDNDPAKFIAWFDQADEAALREAGLIVDPEISAAEQLAAAQLADRAKVEEAAEARQKLEEMAARAPGAPAGDKNGTSST